MDHHHHQQCAVCLETLFAEDISKLLVRHLQTFLDSSSNRFAYAYPAENTLALQEYITRGDFYALQSQIQIQTQTNQSNDAPHTIISQWKSCANLDMQTMTLHCGHSFHARCIQGLMTKSHYLPVEFPLLPRCRPTLASVVVASPLQQQQKTIVCPICRTAVAVSVSSFLPSADYQYVQQKDQKEIGPYRLKPGALVWVYDQFHQPGHPEAGSLAILHGYTTGCRIETADVELLPNNAVISLPCEYIFDFAAFFSTGIPCRFQVSNRLQDDFAVSDVMYAANTNQDHRWAAQIKIRKQYIDRVFENSAELCRIIQEYLQNQDQWSILSISKMTTIPENIHTVWQYIVLPRMGVLGRYDHLFYPKLSSNLVVPYPVVEYIAKQTKWSVPVTWIACKYASAGWACGDWMRKTPHFKDPMCIRYFTHTGLQTAKVTLPSWARKMHLWSVHEMNRIRQWCQLQHWINWHGHTYFIPQDISLSSRILQILQNDSAVGKKEALAWLKKRALLLPELFQQKNQRVQVQMQLQLQCEDLAMIYWCHDIIRNYIDKFRETRSTYPVAY